MRTTIISILLFIISVFPINKVNAETINVQKCECDIRAGLTIPLGGYHSGSSQVGASIGIEARRNIKGTPWDCGLMLELSTARRGYNHLYSDNFDRWQSNRTLALALTGDYNFRQGNKVNPFVGTGVGVAFNDVVGDNYFPSKGVSMAFSPRIGVEFLYHIRLSAQFNVSRNGYNNISFNLGFVLGGRPKRR